MSGSLFPEAERGRDERDAALVAAYERAGRTLDDLPYTDEFEALYAEVSAAGFDRRGAFHRLHTLRKAGRLPRLGRVATRPTRVEPEEEAALLELVVAEAGSVGQRDQLPFTEGFDRVLAAFNARTGRDLRPHDLWRLIARLAK